MTRVPLSAGFLLALLACGEGCGRSAATEDRGQAEPPHTDSVAVPQAPAPAAQEGYSRWNLPYWVTDILAREEYRERFELSFSVNPYYQRGRFDDDDDIDVAVLVIERASGKRGIAVIHRANGTVHLLGAGRPVGNGGDDFGWLGVWRVEDGALVTDPGRRGREVLFVEKPESAGGLIWWNGTTYVWTQHGD